MSGSASITLEQAILGHTLGFAQMAFPSQVYVALCSASMPPSETVRGIEAFGGGYTRMRATFALIDTPANIAANTTSIEWPVAAASWGTLGYFELWDAATGGNRLYWGPFSPPDPITVYAGDIVRFSAGTLGVQASSGSGGTTSIGAYLPLAGGTLSGALLLAADPTTYLQAATKQYVDAHSGTGGGPGFLPLSGGTMLGGLTLAGNATAPLQAVPLQQLQSGPVINVLDHGAKGDGTTDDTAAIQGVLNGYAGKATVFIPDTGSSYVISSSPSVYGLTLPSNTDLLLNGTLKLLAGYDVAGNGVLNLGSGVSRINVRGHGVLDGNVASGAISAGINGTCSNLQVSGITIQNTYYWGLNIANSSHVRVNSVTITGFGAGNEFAVGSDDCWLTNCTIDGSDGKDAGFTFYGGVTNSGAIGNIIRNCGINGSFANIGLSILADGSGATAQGCHNIIMADNLCYNNGASGIWVDVHVATIHSGIIIANNRCHDNCQFGGDSADIHVGNANDVTVIGNQSQQCKYPYGIYVTQSVGLGRTLVTSNYVIDAGYGGSAGVGLYIDSAAHVVANGNYFYSPSGSMHAWLSGTAGPNNVFIGNYSGGLPRTITLQSDSMCANAEGGNLYQYAPGTVLQTSSPMQIVNNAGTGVRWYLGQDGSTESGGNTGSNFEIISVNDASTGLLFNCLSINRATGQVTLQVAPKFTVLPTNAANDAAASAAGVSVGGVYRNGSVLQVRVV